MNPRREPVLRCCLHTMTDVDKLCRVARWEISMPHLLLGKSVYLTWSRASQNRDMVIGILGEMIGILYVIHPLGYYVVDVQSLDEALAMLDTFNIINPK